MRIFGQALFMFFVVTNTLYAFGVVPDNPGSSHAILAIGIVSVGLIASDRD